MTKLTTNDIKTHIASTVTQADVDAVIKKVGDETYGQGFPVDVEENMLTTLQTPSRLVRVAKNVMYDNRLAREYSIKPYAIPGMGLGLLRVITDATDTQVLEVRYGHLYTPDEFVFALVESDAHDVPHFVVTYRALWEKKGFIDDCSRADADMKRLGLESISDSLYELGGYASTSLEGMRLQLLDLGYIEDAKLKEKMTNHGCLGEGSRPSWMSDDDDDDDDVHDRHTSSELTRSQLVGMIATLRGSLYSLIQLIGDEVHEDLDAARVIYDQTTGDTDDEDLVDGGFDMTWRG